VVITHLPDTGWLIRSLRKNTAYTATLRKIGTLQLAVSLVSVAELLEGVYLANDPVAARRALDLEIAGMARLGLDEAIANLYGQHRAQLRRTNQLIGQADLLIAVTALYHNLTVLTTNPGEFQRVPGLSVISTPF
jgi:predicted nucleic acid-binding protein